MKKNADLNIPALCMAMHRARYTLRRHREERREMVRQFVGRHWSEEGSRLPVPVNLIALYISIVGRAMIPKNPRVMLSTFNRQDKPVVSAMQDWCNKEIVQMHLAKTIERVVTDALFSIGIAKVALATPAESAATAWNLRAGQPFAESVDLDDFVYDIHARSMKEVSYVGHRYRVPLDVVRESKDYTKDRKQLSASEDPLYNLEGDERISTLGRGMYGDQKEEYEQMVDLWEVYLPRHRLVVTLSNDYLTGPSSSAEPLRTQTWVGPDCGPYHILRYQDVPGNSMPKGPVMDLVDLHEGANRTYRKLMRTVDRLKEVTAYRRHQSEDGQRALEANDGDAVGFDDPDAIKQIVMNGSALQVVTQTALELINRYDFMAGNLSMVGGLSPQAKTLGQDKMLDENANRTVASMQADTVDYTAGILKALCWYWHHDPFKVQKSLHTIGASQIMRAVGPAQRSRVAFEDMDIHVDPYSMQHQTPQQRAAALNQFVTQTIIPMMPILQQQGVALDINAFLSKQAQYMDMPDLPEIITMQDPPTPEQGAGGPGGPQAPGAPGETTRNYVRQSMPGRTQKGTDMGMISSMAGGTPGASQNGLAPPTIKQ
jgi:hypothetical protein